MPSARASVRWSEIALLFAAVGLAYLPVWHAGFIWDDDGYVTRPALRSLHGLGRIWSEVGATDQYYPLLHTAFWVEYRLWGTAALGYHLVNVALHAGAAGLLLAVLRRLALPGALLAALVFALHPVAVESVAWVAEQKNTLSAVFYFGAALLFWRWHEGASGRPARYAAATLCFVLALLSKTVTATLPAALLVVAWWRVGWSGRAADRRLVRALLPWLIAGAGAGLLSAWVENHIIGAHGAAFALSGLQRALLAGRVAWFYAAKVVWPAHLIFFYPRWPIEARSMAAWISPLAALAGLAVLARAPRRGPLAGALFFVGTLFPVLGFFNVYPFRYSYVADHWQYLACLGLIVPACAGLTVAFQPWPRPIRVGAAAGLVAILGLLTWRQSGMYNDMETFYRTTIARNPGCWMAENNLGDLLRARGRTEEARACFAAALALDPKLPEAHNNLGAALADAGRFPEAIGQYRAALALEPNYAAARLNLAAALRQVGDQAIAEYDLGVALAQTGQAREAIRHYQAALRLKPEYPEAENNLGAALATLGRPAEAIPHYEAALRLKPDYAAARANLELARRSAGN